MLQNITFSADEDVISKARERAADQRTTLNGEFRRWRAAYAERPRTSAAFAELMARFDYAGRAVRLGRMK
jgi:hypothetical protein